MECMWEALPKSLDYLNTHFSTKEKIEREGKLYLPYTKFSIKEQIMVTWIQNMAKCRLHNQKIFFQCLQALDWNYTKILEEILKVQSKTWQRADLWSDSVPRRVTIYTVAIVIFSVNLISKCLIFLRIGNWFMDFLILRKTAFNFFCVLNNRNKWVIRL